MKIRKKENINNIACFYHERAPQKAILKSAVRTVIALASREQGQFYTFESSTTLWAIFKIRNGEWGNEEWWIFKMGNL